MIAGRNHNQLALQGFALVNAAVLGKVMLIAEDMKVGRRFKHLPLFWSVLYKSCLFALREISRVLGKDVLWNLMFRHAAKDRPCAFAPVGGEGNGRTGTA